MHFFAYGADPLLHYLDRRLSGIPLYSLPVLGPTMEINNPILPPLVEKYKVIGYTDDIKPAVTSMKELTVVDEASSLF